MSDHDVMSSRRAILLGAVTGAVLVPALAEAAAPPPPPTKPRQGWAHKDGRIAMKANGAADVLADPMAYLQIQEAFARYGMAHDEVQIPVLDSMFTDDALLEVADGSGTPFQTVRSRTAIVTNFANVLSQQRDQRRHCFSNILIESLTATEAQALAYALVSVAADGLILGATVFYSASLRRADGKGPWRFSKMFIGMDAYVTAKPKV
jgi:hypothetical protein